MTDRLERVPDTEDTLRRVQDDHGSRIRKACPGIVQSVTGQTCSVQPAVQELFDQQNGTQVWKTLPLLVNVPISWVQGGGLCSTFPLTKGDEVTVIFTDRCLDAWRQSGGVQPQTDCRMHSLSDAIAIPGLCSAPRDIPNISTTSAQVRTIDGTTYIEVTQTKVVNIVAPVGCNITGNLTVTGDVTTTGTLKNNNVNVGSTHTHSGVQAGSSNSGQPNP